MLPTQGQGASQSVEDAEALGAIFADVKQKPTGEEVAALLKVPIHIYLCSDSSLPPEQTVFECRYERATLIQSYSRQSGKPATDKSSNKITM